MKIPNTIRIAGVEYKIRFVSSLRDGGRVLYGQIDYGKMEILLNEDCNMDHQRACLTFLHEVLHGIVEANGMKVENEEAVVEMFARGLYQILQDNGRRLFDILPAESCSNQKEDTDGNRT